MNILFEQPLVERIADHFQQPLATGKPVPTGEFCLVLWQADTLTENGLLVPSTTSFSDITGFQPNNPALAQLAFYAPGRYSVAQAEGSCVGAYLNSADIYDPIVGQKMMITPQYIFPGPPRPFAQGSLVGGLNLQVPVAVGKDTYVVLDHQFEGPQDERLSFGVILFHNGGLSAEPTTGYDEPSHSFMFNSALGKTTYVTDITGSAADQPWVGLMPFAYSIHPLQFSAALDALKLATDPAEWRLLSVHLNAEFHFNPAPARLGWSMANLRVGVQP